MRARFVRVQVQAYASGYEAQAVDSGIAVNGFASETDAVRRLAIALNFKPGNFEIHFQGKAGDGIASNWSISEAV